MKSFWKRYSYDIVKVFLFHLICSVFAFTLTFFERTNLTKILFSAFSILIFMFLLYGEIWKIGARDATKNEKRSNHLGVLIGLWGTLLNWLIAIFMLLCSWIPKIPEFLKSVFMVVDLVYNGMFLGIFKIDLNPDPEMYRFLIDSHVWIYFLTAVPALFTCWLGYYLGRKEMHLTKLFIPVTPEEKELKEEEKKIRKGNTDDQ